jgi:hypothetical protein
MKSRALLLVLLALALFASASCSGGSKIENNHEDNSIALTSVEASQKTPAADIDALFDARLDGPLLPPNEKPDEDICTDYSDKGLLRICYQSDSNARLKLQVIKDGNSVHYNLKGDGSFEDFSLQYGSGDYTARIMQNIKDDEYFVVKAKSFTVTLSDENAVYLNSIQNVNWSYQDTPIRDVRYIVSGSLIGLEDARLLSGCSDDLYQYIINNIEYDSLKIFNLMYDYLPDIEKTYLENTGICYDYASLFAAMLRSINIPAKLVKGYTAENPKVYHAWNEVYIDGEWVVIDTTLDASLPRDKAVMKKQPMDYAKVYEY